MQLLTLMVNYDAARWPAKLDQKQLSIPYHSLQKSTCVQGNALEHGNRAGDPIRFGSTVLTRFRSNSAVMWELRQVVICNFAVTKTFSNNFYDRYLHRQSQAGFDSRSHRPSWDDCC